MLLDIRWYTSLFLSIWNFLKYVFNHYILTYMPCDQRTYSEWFEFFEIYWHLLSNLTNGLFWEMLHLHLKRKFTLTWLGTALCICELEHVCSSCSNLLHSYCFCPCYQLRGMIKSPTVIIDLSVPPFSSIDFCLMDFEAKKLGAYIFMVAISFWWTDSLKLWYIPF